MNKALLRQLKRTIGIGDEAALAVYLEALRTSTVLAHPELQGLLAGFGDLLQRVDASYEQYERDLALRTRSLELSSLELSNANEKLRSELASRESALGLLRHAIRGLLPGGESNTEAVLEDNIEGLSRCLAELVSDRELGRLALDNQKFALDQHAIVSITDTSGVIVYANDRFCEISGYQRAELIGSNHRIIKSGIHPPTLYRDMWGAITLGHVWHGEICNRAKSGKLYWVSATIVPLLGADGQPEQYIGIRTDISDRKRMEAELSEQLDLVEGLIEAIPLPVYIKNTEGRYMRFNRAFELFFGAERDKFIGKTLRDLLTAEDALIHIEKDAELLALGGSQTYEALVHGRNGSSHDTIYRKAALTRRDGSIYGLLGTIIDITERKKAEADMQQAKEAAEAASQAKSDFLANMSHEIRTPMNGIIGMTDLALDTALTEEQREFLGIVKSSAESLLTIINDILDFSKIEAGKLLVEKISFDLHRVVAETLKTLSLRAHEKNIELVFEIMPDVPRHVLGDPSRLRQVLVNLIGNAIKFTTSGEIAVRAELTATNAKQPTVQFSVRDTGVGIAPEKQQSIFEAFTQEDTSTTRKFGGTGLGLSISRRLVELMNGRIWLESQLGKGSTFYFALKLQLDMAPPEASSNHIELRELQRTLDILLVEDHLINQKLALTLLEKWGHRTTLAGNGQEAIALVAKHDFDLILMDVHMPVMSGIEATREIRAREAKAGLPRTPIIAMTAAAMQSDREACIAGGMDDYLSKPVRTKDLLEKLLAYGAHAENGEKPAFNYGAALHQADQETVEIIAEIFLTTWERDLQQLRSAVSSQDAATAERAAHSLKGTLATFCADPAMRVASDLERRARNQNLEGMAPDIDSLRREIELLEPHIRAIAARVSG